MSDTPAPLLDQGASGLADDIFARGRAISPLVRAAGLAHLTLARPRPDEMRRFLLDFGLRRSAQDRFGDYFRGTSSAHHLLSVRRSPEPGFVGLAMQARSAEDLETLTRIASASGVTASDEAGGGHRVRLRTPAGFQLDVVHGIRELEPMKTRAPLPTNRVRRRARVNSPQRTEKGPAQVERLAHIALQVRDLDREVGFFMQHLGLIASDFLVTPRSKRPKPVAAFLRVDAGREVVDHHCLALYTGPQDRFLYASFEVLDFDDIAVGGENMYRAGARHVWGPGRHVLGSGLFDYWRDPYGDVFGHVSDGDLFNAEIVPREHRASRASLQQWGRPVPEDFFDAQVEVRGLKDLAARLRADPRARRWLAFGRALRG